MWNVKLTPQAQRELKRLEEDIRDDAVSLLLDLHGIFLSNRVQLENYERYERVKFARNQFRIVYRINRKHTGRRFFARAGRGIAFPATKVALGTSWQRRGLWLAGCQAGLIRDQLPSNQIFCYVDPSTSTGEGV